MPDCSAQGPNEIECRQIAELLADYLDGTLPGHQRDLIDFHIDGCPPCVAFINTYRGTIQATRDCNEIQIPVELKKRLLAVLKSDRPASQQPRS